MKDEGELIAQIATLFSGVVAEGAERFADDCAQLPSLPGGYTRVLSTDVVVEGVDFDERLYPLRFAGGRALAQNLSDLAACGAKPLGFLWSLALPKKWLLDDARRLFEFVEGAAQVSRQEGAFLFGGDLSSTTGPACISITVMGDVLGQPLKRSGVKPGDAVVLGRKVGASAAGLKSLQQGDRFSLEDARHAAHAAPRAQLQLGQDLVPKAHACLDVSDGLAKDLHRLCAASQVGARIDVQMAMAEGVTVEDALYGGEDYALLFAWPDQAPPVGLVIGTFTEDTEVWATDNGITRLLDAGGYDHFDGSS